MTLIATVLSVALVLVLCAGALVWWQGRRRRERWLDAEDPVEYFDPDDPVETFVPSSHQPTQIAPVVSLFDDVTATPQGALMRDDITQMDRADLLDPFENHDLANWQDAAEEEEVQATEIFGARPEDFAKLGLMDPDEPLR